MLAGRHAVLAIGPAETLLPDDFPSRATATAIDGMLVSTSALVIRSRTGSNGSWAAAIRQTHATAAIQSASRQTVILEIIAMSPP